ncbi:MAG: hypothetical protein ACK5SF_10710, partial [Hyphomonadaceae bacterium]
AHRSAMAHHDHWSAQMGAWVMINAAWYKTLVAATSRRNALVVAKLYDQNKAWPATLEWEGQPVTMVSFKDPNTGLYL